MIEARRRLLGELGVAVGAPSRPGVPGGGLHLTVLGAPFGGPGGKELRRLRLGPVELCLEHLAKRLVETVGALVEGNEEGRGLRQPFQPLGGSAGLERPVAEAGRQALEHGDALEKAHVLLLEPGEALLAEVVVDVPVGPAERAQVLPLDLVGERGQVQPRRPALEARGQRGDHLAGGVHAGAAKEERRLVCRHAQVAGAELDQPLLPVEGDRRSAREQQLRPRREVGGERLDDLETAAVLEGLEVVEDDANRRSRAQRPSQPGRRARWLVDAAGPADGNRNVTQEGRGLVVRLVHGQPGDRQVSGRGDLGKERRLAVSGGGDKGRDRGLRGGVQALRQRRPRHDALAGRRRLEPRIEERRSRHSGGRLDQPEAFGAR